MAGNLTQLQWVPPPIGTWNLTHDCSSHARFVNTIIRKSESGLENLDMCAVDVDALYGYAITSLPFTRDESARNVTRARIAIWYLAVCESPVFETQPSQCSGDYYCLTALEFRNSILAMIREAQSGGGDCLGEVLSSLDIKGNADMAGIGVSRVTITKVQQHLRSAQVMTSFCIEAFLIIAFLMADAAAQVRHNRAPHSRREKISDTLRAVLPTFYWSSVVLSLGITSASFKDSFEAANGGRFDQAEKWSKGESIYSPYDIELAVMASLFSALPPLMAGIMLRQSSQRRRLLNVIILSFLEIFPTPIFIIFMQGGSLPEADNGAQVMYNLPFVRNPYAGLYAITAFPFFLSMMLIGWIVLLCRREKSGQAKVPSRPSTCIVVSSWVVQVILLALMISALIILFLTRAKIIDAGDDSQLEWSFGQVLALTTWIPILVDFVYTICGKHHTSSLITPYDRD